MKVNATDDSRAAILQNPPILHERGDDNKGEGQAELGGRQEL